MITTLITFKNREDRRRIFCRWKGHLETEGEGKRKGAGEGEELKGSECLHQCPTGCVHLVPKSFKRKKFKEKKDTKITAVIA